MKSWLFFEYSKLSDQDPGISQDSQTLFKTLIFHLNLFNPQYLPKFFNIPFNLLKYDIYE